MYVYVYFSTRGMMFFSLLGDNGVIKTEMKGLMTRFTNDTIATSAFGIEVDSINEDNNEFYLMAKDITDLNSKFRWVKIVLMFISPKLITVSIQVLYKT